MNIVCEKFVQKADSNLFGHLKRVGIYVESFCNELASSGYKNISKMDCAIFRDAAFFHDIGKLVIPANILNKPGKLNINEMEIVRNHTKYGRDIILMMKSSSYFTNNKLMILAMKASLFHHEWWNGEGYPYGLSKEDIPLIARLTSICDAFDAITYERPYSNPRSIDDAFSEIEKYAGTQFDPLFSCFLLQHKHIFSTIKESFY